MEKEVRALERQVKALKKEVKILFNASLKQMVITDSAIAYIGALVSKGNKTAFKATAKSIRETCVGAADKNITFESLLDIMDKHVNSKKKKSSSKKVF
jgi:hypothetical protein